VTVDAVLTWASVSFGCTSRPMVNGNIEIICSGAASASYQGSANCLASEYIVNVTVSANGGGAGTAVATASGSVVLQPLPTTAADWSNALTGAVQDAIAAGGGEATFPARIVVDTSGCPL
jgi:hypothetical protein